MTAKNLIGDLYSGLLQERDGSLTYSLTVDSSFTSLDFSFNIEERAFDVLKTNPYRNAVFYVVLHTLIQNTFGPGLAAARISPSKFTQQQFNEVASSVLFSPDEYLRKYLKEFDLDYNIASDEYINRQMTSKK